jgi:hypothetical protein
MQARAEAEESRSEWQRMLLWLYSKRTHGRLWPRWVSFKGSGRASAVWALTAGGHAAGLTIHAERQHESTPPAPLLDSHSHTHTSHLNLEHPPSPSSPL